MFSFAHKFTRLHSLPSAIITSLCDNPTQPYQQVKLYRQFAPMLTHSAIRHQEFQKNSRKTHSLLHLERGSQAEDVGSVFLAAVTASAQTFFFFFRLPFS